LVNFIFYRFLKSFLFISLLGENKEGLNDDEKKSDI